MNELNLKLYGEDNQTIMAASPGTSLNFAYSREYIPGDKIRIEVEDPGVFVEVRLDDTMAPAVVFVAEKEVLYTIPMGEQKMTFSPQAFAGAKHLVSARLLDEKETYTRRNLALNPYDQHDDVGIYPHASANVETRGETVFEARNAIDGVFANQSHGAYPYQSWGIGQRADAALQVDLGTECEVDEIRLTIRADFPHDNYWTEATVEFSDGSEVVLQLDKTIERQCFPVEVVARTVKLKDLKKAGGPSPFPALTQIEVWGRPLPMAKES